jgi:hypothetical protein
MGRGFGQSNYKIKYVHKPVTKKEYERIQKKSYKLYSASKHG